MIATTMENVRTAPAATMAAGQTNLSSAIVEMLLRPASYPERPLTVSLVETHISWVFLTDRFVYKLKKPVRFDFLDFGTLKARRQACQDECRLNQRLASGVYLGVLPVTQAADGRLALNGRGSAVEWVVKMRRLPGDRMLDKLITTGQVSETDSQRLANWLANYYHRLSPVRIGVDGYGEKIERHVRDTRAEMLRPDHLLPQDAVKRCHAAELRFLALEQARLDRRVCDGRIVDGHGDLRPEHICLENPPVVFDCIEFSEELRLVDVADEIAFLAMECDRLGAHRLGETIERAYRRASADYFSSALWNFYKCYRACVRAKVAVLTALGARRAVAEAAHERALAYLNLADHYAAELGPPTLIVVSGLMGSGKTTLAAALADRLGSEHLSTDAVRRETLGISQSLAGYNEGHYSCDVRNHVYGDLLHRAELCLRKKMSVVLDGAFLTTSQRHAALALARAAGVLPLIVHCRCPAAVAQQRIKTRAAAGTLSEARAELYASQAADEEPPDPRSTVEIDTTAAVRLQEAAAVDALRRRS